MVNVGILLGKSQHKDSADDVAEWKGLLTDEELHHRQSLKRRGKEALRLPSDQILLRYMQQAALKDPRALQIEAIDSHRIKHLPSKKILKIFDRFDILLLLTTTFLYESRRRQAYEDFYMLLEKTRAAVYPHPSYLRYLFDKSRYLKHLSSRGIPLIPTRFLSWPISGKENLGPWDSVRSWLQNLAQEWDSSHLVLKGSHSAGKALLFEWDSTQEAGHWQMLQEWLTFVCLDLNMPSILVQPYLDAFSKNDEIRTYWLNEEFAYALAMGPPPKMQPRELTTSDGRIHSYIQSLLPLGKEVLSLLPPDGSQPKTLVRLDFVRQAKKAPHESQSESPYFLLNEIETLEACLFPDWTSCDIIERLGDGLMDLCSTLDLSPVR